MCELQYRLASVVKILAKVSNLDERKGIRNPDREELLPLLIVKKLRQQSF